MSWFTRLGRFGQIALALVALQTLFLFWMIHDHDSAVNSGEIITLKTEPVDPRDLFRGEYVTLTYAISRINLDGLPGDEDFKRGDVIHVEITPARDTWIVAGVRHASTSPAKGNKIIRGKVKYVVKNLPRTRPIPGGNDMEEIPCASCEMLNVTYGIEKYFVPEGEGRKLEQERNASRFSVDVALAENGKAVIKDLRLDGELISP